MSRPPSVDESPFFSPFSFVAESPTPGGVLLTLESDIRGVNERINFLDPELQTAANRIEILETLSHGNSDRIQTLADQFSRHIRHLDSLLHRNESLGESQSSQSLPPPPLPPKNSPSPTPPKPESKPKPKPKPKPQPSTKPKRKKRPEHFFPLSPPPRRSAPQGPSVLLQFHDDITKVIERLNFLDPELKSACNRIEILETLSHGNSERLQSLLELLSVSERRLQSLQELEVAGHGSYYQLYYDATLDDTTERREEANTEELHLFNKVAMFEDIWYHALQFLDNYKYDVHNYGPSELYKFADDTGILARHRSRMEKPFTEKDIDVKVVYSELIKMLLDHEERKFPEGFKEVKDIHKIQGFQDLTNRLQYSLNQKFETNLVNVNQQMQELQKQNEAQQKQINYLLERLGDPLQKNLLVTLEQRIDVNEKFIGNLKTHEAEQDERLDNLEGRASHMEVKVATLEKTDKLLGESQAMLREKVESLEAMKEKLTEVDDRSISNLERIILLEEQNQIHVEQATYVETVNNRLVEMEKQKDSNTTDMRLDFEAVNEDLKKILVRIDGHDEDIGMLSADIKDTKKGIDILNNGQVRQDDDIKALEVKCKLIDTHQRDIEELKLDIQALHGLKQDMIAIETRLRSLEEATDKEFKKLHKADNKMLDSMKYLEDDQLKIKDELDELRRVKYVRQEDFSLAIERLNSELERLERLIKDNDPNAADIANFNALISKLRIDLDNVDMSLRSELDKFKDDHSKDIGDIKFEMISQNERDNELANDLEQLKRRTSGIEDEIKDMLRVQAEVSRKFESVDSAIEDAKRDFAKDVKEVKKDLEDVEDDIKEGKKEFEQKIGGCHQRIDELDLDMRGTANKDKTIQKILIDLEENILLAGNNKDGLGDLWKKIKSLEVDINTNATGVIGNKGDIKDMESHLKLIKADLERVDGLSAKNKKSLKELWSDQRRQDDDIIKGNDMKEVMLKIGAIENELQLQAKVDVDLQKSINEVDDRSLKNLERIILLEERNEIQVEQANYVEALNDKLAQLEEDKVQTSSNNENELKELIRRVEEHDTQFGKVELSIKDLLALKLHVKEMKEDQTRQDREIDEINGRIRVIGEIEKDVRGIQATVEPLLLLSKRVEELALTFGSMETRLIALTKDQKHFENRADDEFDRLSKFDKKILDKLSGLEDDHDKLREIIEVLRQTKYLTPADLSIEIDALNLQMKQLKDIIDLIDNKDTSKGVIAMINDLIANLKVDIQAIDNHLSAEISQVRNDHGKEISDLKRELIVLNERDNRLDDAVSKLSGKTDKIEDDLQDLMQLKANIEIRFGRVDVAVEDARTDWDREAEALRKNIDSLGMDIRDGHLDIEAKIRDCHARIDGIDVTPQNTVSDKVVEQLQMNLSQLEINLSRQETDLASKIKKNADGIKENNKNVWDLVANNATLKASLDKVEDLAEKNRGSLKDLWQDQRRQDDDMINVHGEIDHNKKNIANLLLDFESFENSWKKSSASLLFIEGELKKLFNNDADLKDKFENIDDQSLKILERLVLLEERNQINVEQANYVQALNNKLVELEEDKHQTGADFGNDIQTLRELWEKQQAFINILEQDLKHLDSKLDVNVQNNFALLIEGFKDGDFKDLVLLVENKLHDVELQSDKNKGHVDRLRELNSKLMVEIPTQVNKELDSIRADIDSLNGMTKTNVNVIRVDLEEDMGKLRDELNNMAVNVNRLEERNEVTMTQIQQQSITVNETKVEEINNKLVVATGDLRKEFEELKEWQKNAQDVILNRLDTNDHDLRNIRERDSSLNIQINNINADIKELHQSTGNLVDKNQESQSNLIARILAVEAFKDALGDLDEKMQINLERIIQLEERNQIQVEQASYVETVNNKLVQIEQDNFQTKADVHDDTAKIQLDIDALRKEMGGIFVRLDGADGSLKSMSGLSKDIKDIWDDQARQNEEMKTLLAKVKDVDRIEEISDIKSSLNALAEINKRIDFLVLDIKTVDSSLQAVEKTIANKEPEIVEHVKEELTPMIRAEIDEVKEVVQDCKKDVVLLQEEMKEQEEKDVKLEKAIESLHVEADEVKDKMEDFYKINADVAIKFEAVEDNIQDAKKELHKGIENITKGGQDDIDGKIDDFYARIDALEKDLKDTAKENMIQKILIDLRHHEEDININKDSLAGYLGQIKKLEKDLTVAKENIFHNRQDLDGWEGKFRELDHKLEEVEDRAGKNQKSLKELWVDQRRQDDDMIQAKQDIKQNETQVITIDNKMNSLLGNVKENGNKIHGLEDEVGRLKKADIELRGKLDVTDDRSLSNLERIILLEERNQIQVEQANYVETINNKLEEERKQNSENADKWRDDTDRNKNELDTLAKKFNNLMSRVDGHDGSIDALSSLQGLKVDINNIWEDQKRQDRQMDKMQAKVAIIDSHETEIKNIKGSLANLLGRTELTGILEAQREQGDQIKNILKQLLRLDVHEKDIGNLNITLKDLLTLRVNIDELMQRQDRLDGNLEETKASFKKRTKKISDALDESDEKQKGVNNQFDVAITDLRALLEALERRSKDNDGDLRDLEGRFETNIEKYIGVFVENFKGGDFKELMDLVENKLYEVDRLSQKNKKHVEDLRELNNKLMMEIQTQVSQELQMLRVEIGNIDGPSRSDIDLLRQALQGMEGDFGNLKNNVNKISSAMDKIEPMHVAAITEIRSANELMINSKIGEVHGFNEKLKKRVVKLEDNVDLLQRDLQKTEVEIRTVDERLVVVDGERTDGDRLLKEDSVLLGKGIRELRTDLTHYKENHWSLINHIYGALRRYTIVLKSKGPAKLELPYCMGVYRMVDFRHGKPVYKQDGGEHFIYFHRETKQWMVGTKTGHQFAWVRNARQGQTADILANDLRSGWQYQPLARDGNIQTKWMHDDSTLTVEALGDVERISEFIRSIENAQEVD